MQFNGIEIKQIDAKAYNNMPDNLSLYLVIFGLNETQYFFKTDAPISLIASQFNDIQFKPNSLDDQEHIDSIDWGTYAADTRVLALELLERRIKHSGKFFKLIDKDSAEREMYAGDNFYIRKRGRVNRKEHGKAPTWYTNLTNPLIKKQINEGNHIAIRSDLEPIDIRNIMPYKPGQLSIYIFLRNGDESTSRIIKTDAPPNFVDETYTQVLELGGVPNGAIEYAMSKKRIRNSATLHVIVAILNNKGYVAGIIDKPMEEVLQENELVFVVTKDSGSSDNYWMRSLKKDKLNETQYSTGYNDYHDWVLKNVESSHIPKNKVNLIVIDVMSPSSPVTVIKTDAPPNIIQEEFVKTVSVRGRWEIPSDIRALDDSHKTVGYSRKLLIRLLKARGYMAGSMGWQRPKKSETKENIYVVQQGFSDRFTEKWKWQTNYDNPDTPDTRDLKEAYKGHLQADAGNVKKYGGGYFKKIKMEDVSDGLNSYMLSSFHTVPGVIGIKTDAPAHRIQSYYKTILKNGTAFLPRDIVDLANTFDKEKIEVVSTRLLIAWLRTKGHLVGFIDDSPWKVINKTNDDIYHVNFTGDNTMWHKSISKEEGLGAFINENIRGYVKKLINEEEDMGFVHSEDIVADKTLELFGQTAHLIEDLDNAPYDGPGRMNIFLLFSMAERSLSFKTDAPLNIVKETMEKVYRSPLQTDFSEEEQEYINQELKPRDALEFMANRSMKNKLLIGLLQHKGYRTAIDSLTERLDQIKDGKQPENIYYSPNESDWYIFKEEKEEEPKKHTGLRGFINKFINE